MPRVLANSPVKVHFDTKQEYSLVGSDEAPPTESATFYMRWEDRLTFLIWAWGWTASGSSQAAAGDGSGGSAAISTSSGASTTFTRAPRLSSPYTPGLVAIAYRVQGVGKEAPISNDRPYSTAFVTLTFGSLPFATEGTGAYLEIGYKGSSNLRTRPNVSSKFASNNEVIDFDSGVWVGQTAIQLSFKQVANWPALKSAFEGVKGKINADAVTIDGTNYPAGYLLIPTYEMSQSVAIMGSPQYEAGMAILASSIPWNSAVRSDGTVDAVVPPPYQTTNFAGLFQ